MSQSMYRNIFPLQPHPPPSKHVNNELNERKFFNPYPARIENDYRRSTNMRERKVFDFDYQLKTKLIYFLHDNTVL